MKIANIPGIGHPAAVPVQHTGRTAPEQAREQQVAPEQQIPQPGEVPAAGQHTGAPPIARPFDTYAPQPPRESPGVYRLTHDETGRPVVQVDEPSAAGQPETASPSDTPAAKTTVNTDRVDREIEQLRQTRAQLERRAASAETPAERQKLETELARVDAQLQMKDNDAYRRQHAQITEQFPAALGG